jgi:hypothetical protein
MVAGKLDRAQRAFEPQTSLMFVQHWLRADWHLLRVPASPSDVIRLGSSLRTIGKAAVI